MDERFVVAGVAHVRSSWFAQVAAWASGGVSVIEFVKCVSVAELRARIRAGVAFSAALVDASVSGVDRDLLTVAAEAGISVIVIADPRGSRDWRALGAAAILPPAFTTDDLLTTLEATAVPVGERTVRSAADVVAEPAATSLFRGNVVAVCGRGGAGTSVVSMALAQGFGVAHGSTCLADWTLNGDLAAYHDAADVIPAVPELVDAHRTAVPERHTIEAMLHQVEPRHYALLLGVRSRRDWVALRPNAVAATLASLAAMFRWTVSDITADLESESDTGSTEIEDRHALAHSAIDAADLVVAVANPTLKGVRDVVGLIDDLGRLGVASQRIQVLVNRAPRSPRVRAEVTRAISDLSQSTPERSPIFLPERRGMELLHRCADRLPSQMTMPLASAIAAIVSPVAVAPSQVSR